MNYNYIITILIGVGVFILILGALIALFSSFYRKVEQSKVVIRNGVGGQRVSFSGILVVPIIHRYEIMDISVKRIEIAREKKDGLICKDNLRADIRVAFFVRVNENADDVLKVAKMLGCDKASDQGTLTLFFDAKFSEALKTAGKQFEFTQLYTEREEFKARILQIIGKDLNGYILDDVAIDYIEQTHLSDLDPDNIMDSEGIKKIVEKTANQAILSNEIKREKEKTIKKQDVSATEAILELEKQKEAAIAKQNREIAVIQSKEKAEADKVAQEELFKSEMARVSTEEKIGVAEQNKERQIIVAQKTKESTEAVETVRVNKSRELEDTEREKLVALAKTSKDTEVEKERKRLEEVARERVVVEKDKVTEEEAITTTRVMAEANRQKGIAVTKAEQDSESAKIVSIVKAEAELEASRKEAEKVVLLSEAKLNASTKDADAIKVIAEANVENKSVDGMSMAKVTKAQALAEAEGGVALAETAKVQGLYEAEVAREKYTAEADGISRKADSMKKFNEAGKEHEEFKLQLAKDERVQIKQLEIDGEVAKANAEVVKSGLEAADIEIIGGEQEFFTNMIDAVTKARKVDRVVGGSKVLTDVKDTFFTGDPEYFAKQIINKMDQFNMTSEDIKNLSIAGALGKMVGKANTDAEKGMITKLLDTVTKAGYADYPANLVEQFLK